MNTGVTVEAKTIEMEYEPSEIGYESGVKRHETSDSWRGTEFARGQRVIGGGCGTYITATCSHFILWVEIDGKKYAVWTERAFRSLLEIKRLTKKARSKIEAEMPKTVQVEEQESIRGTKYYSLTEDSAVTWALKVLGV